MSPSIPRLTEPLSDGVIAVRLAGERDIPEILISHQDDPEMYARLGLERPPSGAELGRHFERSAPELAAGRSISLTVTEPGSDAAVGGIDVHSLDWSDARAELALWLAPQVRGRGYAARALRLAAGWLFSACKLQRVQFMTETDNEAMLAAGRAAGFHYEGVLRGYAREPGARRDLAVMSLLPADLSG